MRRAVYLVLAALFGLCQGAAVNPRTRKYFIAASEVEWDYAPGGKNLVHPSDQGDADEFLKSSSNRIGGKYKKATYFQYTDDTFATQIAKPAHLGILGPTLHGEVGDTIEVVYFNNATNIYSLHPHGVFYKKENEGAVYVDGTSGRMKNDDVVFPGQKVTLTWKVTDADAPGPGDPDCVPWVYHSHVETVKDTSTGVIGTLVTCRKGVLNDQNQRTDVDVEYPLLVKIFDENLSWLLDDNIQQFCQDPSKCQEEAEDEDFVNSNYMHSINGYMFGHLPGLKACVGQRVQFYVIGMGNEFDVHSLFFHGMNLKYQHTRGDTVSVFTATFVAAETTPTKARKTLITDVVDEFQKGGISAYFETTICSGSADAKPFNGSKRNYFLAADEVTWDYGPGEMDQFTGKKLTEPQSMPAPFFRKTLVRIGGKYTKARFVEYTDDTFKTRVTRSKDDHDLGIMGPVIRAEPGDIVHVTLQNHIDQPVSFLPHGLVISDRHTLAENGVAPGSKYWFQFDVPEKILDGVKDDCLNFLYTSAVDSVKDHHSGLVGQILICQKGYDRIKSNQDEVFLLLATFDENKSFFLDKNLKSRLNTTDPDAMKSNEEFVSSNIYYSVNGYSFGSMPKLDVCQWKKVTWYVAALGSELDVHPLTFDGNSFNHLGNNRDVQKLVAGSTAALHMTPDNIGSWLVMSNSYTARDGGAYAMYNVVSCPGYQAPWTTLSGKKRNYYVAAEEVEWDYAPLERGIIDGMDLNDPRSPGNIFIKNDESFIGSVYRKAVFREYTSLTFSQRKKRTSSEKQLDILGPVLKAEVGDTIVVYFRNKATHPFSMHPHGLHYSRAMSGRPYLGLGGVQPGNDMVYQWKVPERSGPGPEDPNCIPWLYYSTIDPTKDPLSGLVGPIVICRPGTLDQNNKRNDVDREMYVHMSVFNENLSWYLQKNIELYAPARKNTDYGKDEDFEESNKLHSINGRLYGNNPDFVMEFNDSVIWYFMALGAEIDIHTIHTHGNTFLHSSAGHRDDVISMFPGMAESVSMQAENAGTWFLHCHVLDHILAGMETTYTVLPKGQSLPKEEESEDLGSPCLASGLCPKWYMLIPGFLALWLSGQSIPSDGL